MPASAPPIMGRKSTSATHTAHSSGGNSQDGERDEDD